MGLPFIIMQQVMPQSIMDIIIRQHSSIILAIFGSPDVHVMQMPPFIGLTVHMPATMFIMHMGMPFIIMQHDIIAPGCISHIFCSDIHAAASSHIHIIIMPPSHGLMVILQTGTIMPVPAGIIGMAAMLIGGMLRMVFMAALSAVLVVVLRIHVPPSQTHGLCVIGPARVNTLATTPNLTPNAQIGLDSAHGFRYHDPQHDTAFSPKVHVYVYHARGRDVLL